MKILVLNCGSSSIKYKLFDDNKALDSGLIERIGEKGSKISNYGQGVRLMLDNLIKSKKITSLREIDAVGHRVVHGGEVSKPCRITKKVMKIIREFSSVAPLHNPVELKGIREVKKVLKVQHVAVFDTAFHQSMPEKAFIYALPYRFYKREGIRRYGFHGTSHEYVSLRAAELLRKPITQLKIITCHLGAGCSITAIDKGKVVDTSMGFTPLEGLVMGTRTGDIDPGVIIYLSDKKKISGKRLDAIFNKQSGLKGIAGSKDMRDIIEGYKNGSKRCELALDVFCYRIRKYIAAYYAVLNKADAIVFTAGIGENSPLVRKLTADIPCLAIKIDANKNNKVKEGVISSRNSKVKVLVIPTDEEKMIAIEVQKVIK
ncbi:acetate kinase [Candidatus Woesearchaeota archaeon]|nr:acetate kinase [Candidatus Woesearchaeota archaeon]